MNQALLFDETVTPLVHPTNRYNLLGHLGSAMLLPFEGHRKYYADLLQDAPGRLACTRAPVARDVLDYVSSEDPSAFPVVIELSEDVASSESNQSSTIAGGWHALAAPRSLDDVRAIHFRSSRDLEEHSARAYDDVRHRSDLYRVSPEVFADESVADVAALRHWLSTLPTLSASSNALQRLDRHSGGLVMAAAACPATIFAIDMLAQLLSAPRRRPAKGWLGAWHSEPNAAPTRQDTDALLFHLSRRQLAGLNRDEYWRPEEVLRAIESELRAATSGARGEEVLRYLEAIRRILRLERPFERFSPGGLISGKALLVALLRPEPRRFIGWQDSETGADAEVRLAAALLVGSLNGRIRMPIEFRPQTLDEWLAERIVADLGIVPSEGARVRRHPRSPTGGDEIRLRAGRQTILTYRLDPTADADDLVTATADAAPTADADDLVTATADAAPTADADDLVTAAADAAPTADADDLVTAAADAAPTADADDLVTAAADVAL